MKIKSLLFLPCLIGTMKITASLLAALAFAFAGSNAGAATIVFTSADFTNVNQLSTTGTLVEARNLGSGTSAVSLTVNSTTLTFAATTTVTSGTGQNPVSSNLSVQNGRTDANSVNQYNDAIHTITGLSLADGNSLLDGSVFGSGANSNLVSLTGLTLNQAYQVQFLLVDDRGTTTLRTTTVLEVSPGTNTTGTLDNTSNKVWLVSGTFTADAATQDLVIRVDPTNGGANNTQVNAFQLRAVPEPSSTALLGLAGSVLLLRRRK